MLDRWENPHCSIRLGGLATNEAFGGAQSALYDNVINGDVEALTSLPVGVSHDQLMDLCLNGGYPEHFLKREDPIFHDQWVSTSFTKD